MKKNWPYLALGVGLIAVVAAALYYQFRQKEQPQVAFAPDSSVYSKKNYTTFILDSTALVSFYRTELISDSTQKDISEFYRRRAYQYAWFSENRLTNAALNFNGQREAYMSDFADSSLYNADIDSLLAEAQNQPLQFLKNPQNVQKLELLLTSAFFSYTDKAFTGTVKNPLDLEWFIPRKKKDYQTLLDTLVSAKGNSIREPVNRYYSLLKEQLRKYRTIEKQGGWTTVEIGKKTFKKGDTDSLLLEVKKTLGLLGDLKAPDSTAKFTDSLAIALKRFQHRMGLKESGKLDAATAAELNRPVSVRIRQIMLNMERLRWVPAEMEPDMLLVNIPEFKLHIFEESQQSWMCNVVVGKEATKTSIFKGNLSYVVLNPYWVVTNNIINNEILPRLKQNPGYLARNQMEVVSGSKIIDPYVVKWKSYTKNIPFTIRQKPGKSNSLGKVKFLFPNNYSIYLHDTPSKGLFGESTRAFSHGCIRVAEPERLALHVLKNDPSWNEEKLEGVWKTEKEKWITVKPSLPVYIVYFTAWVDQAGQLNFRNDLYGLDKTLAKEIFGE
ncbi:L,D-transpeptidase family protein [Runella slithyformis]|uniref:ErfK/YbiS/YcfS/YnhG family protein n=1 Tax=Runella slithyformis (strain ATCC 29530 / DSM 19594 / LMG 11500 / NCIMB 11436 / LSU 4) TaxID=761193 RepID=A0A7U3ZH79_RUNSL|nr:L,D-transpeptidase family protein [Runella slithyformis]AEI47135.1 ErfK/YbiS/YcfS/YnhG family protein [Runella slithyformis DSM 19594]